jgi:hypothetical protein
LNRKNVPVKSTTISGHVVEYFTAADAVDYLIQARHPLTYVVILKVLSCKN